MLICLCIACRCCRVTMEKLSGLQQHPYSPRCLKCLPCGPLQENVSDPQSKVEILIEIKIQLACFLLFILFKCVPSNLFSTCVSHTRTYYFRQLYCQALGPVCNLLLVSSLIHIFIHSEDGYWALSRSWRQSEEEGSWGPCCCGARWGSYPCI